jgi:hypothetical protein
MEGFLCVICVQKLYGKECNCYCKTLKSEARETRGMK